MAAIVDKISVQLSGCLDVQLPDPGPENLYWRMGWDRVYFVLARAANLVKIGTSWRLPVRLAEIETMSPVRVELVGHVSGGAERERAYHQMFAAERSHGEWFRYTDEVRHRIDLDCMIDAWNAMNVDQRMEFLRLIEGGSK